MTPTQIIILMFVVLIVVIVLGHPVAFTVGGLAMLFGLAWWGSVGSFNVVLVKNVFGAMNNYIYTAIPMFIFMGAILERSGVGEVLYAAMHIAMGGLRGGLAVATVIICTLLAASTGIIATGVVCMGLLALPAMLRRGYDKQMAAGAVMAGGTLGILIPPSIMLIVMGASAGLSVGKLFAGAVFPGLILSALFTTFILVICFFRRELGPSLPPEQTAISLVRKAKVVLTSVIPPVGLIVAVLGSIFFGVASPTEAASVGALGAVVITICYRRFNWEVVKSACYETLLSGSMIIWILIGAGCYAAIFLGLGGAELIKQLLLRLEVSRWVVLAIILFVIFLLGMVMEWIAIVLIAIPVFFPTIAALGFDPLWFCILMAITLQTGFLTPPYGGALFILKGVAPPQITMGDLWHAAFSFVPLQLIGLAIVILFPQLVLWLPSLMIH